MKKYEEDPDYMEMPCMCGCGNWFDLNDGYSSKKYSSNNQICEDCYNKEQELEEEIETLTEELQELDLTAKNVKKAEKLQEKIDKLKDELYY